LHNQAESCIIIGNSRRFERRGEQPHETTGEGVFEVGILGKRSARSEDSPSNEETAEACEPRCAICGLTEKGVARRTRRRNPNARIVGKLLGLCPKCGNAFCNIHATTHEETERCSVCRSALSFVWDENQERGTVRMKPSLSMEG